MKPSPALTARCEVCPASETIDASADIVRAQLEAKDWLHCPRKGGRSVWRCPEHNPLKLPPPKTYGPSAGWR